LSCEEDSKAPPKGGVFLIAQAAPSSEIHSFDITWTDDLCRNVGTLHEIGLLMKPRESLSTKRATVPNEWCDREICDFPQQSGIS
jgi:hypothetical protein